MDLVTTLGCRIDGITHEYIALRTVHSMGTTSVVAPYRYEVVDNGGRRFHAEIHRSPTPAPRRSPTRGEGYR